MLGRVFEGLMAPAERSESGTFFTPSRLVSAVVRATLAAWLSRRLRVSEERAASLLDSPDARTRDALARITVLDPAVGSGAFLLGALEQLAAAQDGRHPKPAAGCCATTCSVSTSILRRCD
jgi:type I restriction-modification system DNA methylase subunit